MDLLARIVKDLLLADACGVLLLLVRLGFLRFHRRYPGLVSYLAIDLVCGLVGFRYDPGSKAYYWTYFLFYILAGSALLVWMCREMFAELYGFHPGLRGLTQCTLRRSIFIGSGVTIALAPVGIIHWGNPDFRCWQFPLFEVHRCVSIGVVVFVVAMWRKLRLVPLNVPKNVKTYAWSTSTYLALNGIAETAILIVHTRLATIAWSVFLNALALVFYGVLAALTERPGELQQLAPIAIASEDFAWLESMYALLARGNAAEQRGRTATLRRLRLFGLLSSLQSVWRAFARAGYAILRSEPKE